MNRLSFEHFGLNQQSTLKEIYPVAPLGLGSFLATQGCHN
jgi:hypothetical protein